MGQLERLVTSPTRRGGWQSGDSATVFPEGDRNGAFPTHETLPEPIKAVLELHLIDWRSTPTQLYFDGVYRQRLYIPVEGISSHVYSSGPPIQPDWENKHDQVRSLCVPYFKLW